MNKDDSKWGKYLPGGSPKNPFKIVALLNSRAVGDTIFYHVFAASVKRLFDHVSLTMYQRDDREYKMDLLNMNSEADFAISVKPNFQKISIDSFQTVMDLLSNGEPIPGYVFQADVWSKFGCDWPNLILSPGGMSNDYLTCFENPAFLRIPDGRIDELDDELVRYGVTPNRWFCVLNYREPGYKHRPDRARRDLDPKPFMELVDYIIGTLGGQVIRVGHPKMTPFPNRPGFIDLAMIEDNFMLHAHAIARARFMIGSASGISHLGSAVNTPTAITNCIELPYSPGCWRDHDIVLYVNLFEANGRRVTITERIERDVAGPEDLIDLVKNHGHRAEQNTPAELELVAKELMDSTTDCQSWRLPSSPRDPASRPNRFEYPMQPRVRSRIF